MKIKITIILIFATLLTSCNSKKNDLEKYNLKGKVWKLKQTTYRGEKKFGKYQIGDKINYGHSFQIFNEDGNLIETQILDKNSKIKKTYRYSYDENGICSEVTTYEDDKVVEKQINKVEKNHIVEIQVYNEEGTLSDKYQYVYSGADISSGKVFNGDGSFRLSFQYEFSGGLLTKEIVKDSTEEISSIRIYERNKQGDIITRKVEYPKKTNTYSYTSFQYDYDKKGNWFKKYRFYDGEIDDIIFRNIVYYDESKTPKTDKDFIGTWFVVDDNDWIEFRSDKKYDSGYKYRIKEMGTWEINTKQQILTLRADSPKDSEKYKYDFEGYQMILFTLLGEEITRLEKR